MNEAKNILAILTELKNPNYKGGIQVFNNHLVRALKELGFNIRIISVNDRAQDISEENIIPCNDGKARKLLTVWHTIREVVKFKPDLILCGHVNFSPMCMIISKIFNVPYITFTYGVDIWGLNGLKKAGLKHSRNIITISKFTKEKINSQLRDYKEENILILPCTFDSQISKLKPKPEYLMERWGITNEDKIILTIARLSRTEQYKGYDKVIMALKDVLKEIPNVKYILGGSGDDVERIKELIRENGLAERTILPGFIPDDELADYYNLCDVFVMPSKKEGFGIVFLEALACGKPVIAGNKDGSRDALLDGELGILVDPDNVEEIKIAIIKALKGEVDKRLLDGEYLRNKVIDVYNFNKFRERVRIILEGISR